MKGPDQEVETHRRKTASVITNHRFVPKPVLTCVITCNPQTMPARKVLLPYVINEKTKS